MVWPRDFSPPPTAAVASSAFCPTNVAASLALSVMFRIGLVMVDMIILLIQAIDIYPKGKEQCMCQRGEWLHIRMIRLNNPASEITLMRNQFPNKCCGRG